MSRRAVLFDMDGTLVDSEPMHFDAMRKALGDMGYEVPVGVARLITGMTGADCHALLQRTVDFKPSLSSYIEAKYAAYLQMAPSLLRREGIDEALAYLTQMGVPFAIVSNSDRMLVDANLRAVGLSRPGLISVSRNDVCHGKPDPEPFLRAAYLLDVDPADCIVVEDSIPGARAGHAAGMTVIGWPEPHREDLIFPNGTVLAQSLDLTSSLAHCLADNKAIKSLKAHVSR
jgi:HAD superfamily hydrolase (TIGR01509 family)